MTELEVKEAIETILSDKKSYNKSLDHAVNYCRYALSLKGEELRVQCLYILNNISYWRHPEAAKVRKVLKSFVSRG